MGRGRDADAVAVIHAVAEYNGVRSSLTLEDLTRIGVSKNLDSFNSDSTAETGFAVTTPEQQSKTGPSSKTC